MDVVYQYIVICLVAMLGSGLTLFSGFGLGTLMLPVFGLFFPIEIAVAMTAIVHFLNNVFKFVLIGKYVDKNVLIRFGLPSIVAAFIGAYLLNNLSGIPSFYSYQLAGHVIEISLLKLIIALLLIFFAAVDLIPRLKKMEFNKRYLPLGGVLSGFFGGLSGNQGALRSAFLIKSGLDKQHYIATGVAIACLVDISRLSVYSQRILHVQEQMNYSLALAATAAAFIGAYIGNKLIKKVTVKFVTYLVAVFMLVFSVLLGSGII